MDLRVGQRLVRPVADAAMLTPLPPPLLLGSFSAQPCSQFTQQQLQHMQFTMEQQRRDQEKDKQQKLHQLWHKEKSQRSAVASSVVKQKLQEVILKKQKQAALERTSSNPISTPPVGYRELAPDPNVPPQSLVVPSPVQPPSDPPEEPQLRRAASEPNLKVKNKLKNHLNTRKSPLTRKESAPPSIKHRVPETLDSSPSSSSTPVSGCSSPNDSLPTENGALSHEAQRLLLQDRESITHFPGQNLATLPTITLGLPASAKISTDMPSLSIGRIPVLSGAPQVYLGLGEQTGPLSPCLQPVLILESTGLMRGPLLTVPGMSQMPLQFASQLDHLNPLGPHKPLSRTRSEPLPQSPRPLHHHLLQHPNSQLLERLKLQAHLGKQIPKPSEKPRLKQIPSEDMDSEEVGPAGPREVQQAKGQAESLREADALGGMEVASAGEGKEEQINLQHTVMLNQVVCTALLQHTVMLNQVVCTALLQHTVMLNQSLLWEKQKQLQQMRRQTAHMETLAVPMMPGVVHRPLSRTQSSPASTSLTAPLPAATPETSSKPRFTTGLVYDSQMLKHQCTCGDNSRHPEHAGRIQSIWSRLLERGLRNQCESIRGRKATLEELQSVHTERHVLLYGTNPLNQLKLDSRKLSGILSQRMFVILPCRGVGVDNDTIWNEMHTSTASRMAAGSVTELAFKVAKGELKNGFAVVRPPGHHADPSSPMGFCYFNSVAIAARQLQQKLCVSKILIVDWDVHHGNGTQEVFYRDPSVLYISLHRYDDGNFFPGSGGPTEVGSDAGEGFNVNVAWTGGLDPPMGDAEYLAAFRTVVMPIAQEFSPDVVLVSSGFDAAEGHPAPLGGYKVSAKCFGFLTRQLMRLAGGRLVLALEGGHDLTAICDASEACVSALLGMEVEPLPEDVLRKQPCPNAVRSLQKVLQVHSQYWQSVKRVAHTVEMSFLEAQKHDCEEVDTVNALACLSVGVLANKSLPDEPMEHDEDSM
ncbi:histone deacetylase 7 isoform X3 [Brienomyrus brachyistius]|uniref:histone deacetylase 7 isoform X2 n=1 Tax=Brienomyrus brachyistius TaxID=42636 RepID=UPI0020B3D05B|nr:histone deacetylase 7 isoform X2 [Brienomyrus brachyistius]XP_048872628.1 histone deacetylase 7 isoform X3 [Brienomyrus brachyistius]